MLDGKVAVVTGGTRGIGFATVKKFLENEAKVILLQVRHTYYIFLTYLSSL